MLKNSVQIKEILILDPDFRSQDLQPDMGI